MEGVRLQSPNCLKGRVTEKTEVSQPTSTGCKGVPTGHRGFFLTRVLEPGDQDQAGQEGFILTSFQSIQQPGKRVLLGAGDWTTLLQRSIQDQISLGNWKVCETDFKALQCPTHKFSVHKGVELRGKNFQLIELVLLTASVCSQYHIVNDRPDFYPGYFSGCPELFKLSPISGLLVDENKDYVFKYFPPSLPFCRLYVSNELSLVASKHNKPDNSHLL